MLHTEIGDKYWPDGPSRLVADFTYEPVIGSWLARVHRVMDALRNLRSTREATLHSVTLMILLCLATSDVHLYR